MSTQSKTNILFLVPSPLGISPGQRFRFEHFLPLLKEKGIDYAVKPFLTLNARKQLYTPGNVGSKMLVLLLSFIKRLNIFFILHRYQYVYIHRWAATAGPPILEWWIAKVYRKKIIYDFDDSIWVNESAYNKKFLAVKFLSKVAKICRWSYKVSVGNQFLFDFAIKHNPNTVIIPTVVDTNTVHSALQVQNTNYPAVGWTGSFSTLLYLEMVVPVLQRLQEKFNFTFYVIADKDPTLPLKNYQFVKWSEATEVADLLKFHIGIMPLTDDDITRGKCGFKAIQYMSLGIPAVVSPVGVNNKIVTNGVNGFICNTEQEWEESLTKLLTDPVMRKSFGKNARQEIEDEYSVEAVASDFLNLFDNK